MLPSIFYDKAIEKVICFIASFPLSLAIFKDGIIAGLLVLFAIF